VNIHQRRFLQSSLHANSLIIILSLFPLSLSRFSLSHTQFLYLYIYLCFPLSLFLFFYLPLFSPPLLSLSLSPFLFSISFSVFSLPHSLPHLFFLFFFSRLFLYYLAQSLPLMVSLLSLCLFTCVHMWFSFHWRSRTHLIALC